MSESVVVPGVQTPDVAAAFGGPSREQIAQLKEATSITGGESQVTFGAKFFADPFGTTIGAFKRVLGGKSARKRAKKARRAAFARFTTGLNELRTEDKASRELLLGVQSQLSRDTKDRISNIDVVKSAALLQEEPSIIKSPIAIGAAALLIFLVVRSAR